MEKSTAYDAFALSTTSCPFSGLPDYRFVEVTVAPLLVFLTNDYQQGAAAASTNCVANNIKLQVNFVCASDFTVSKSRFASLHFYALLH